MVETTYKVKARTGVTDTGLYIMALDVIRKSNMV